MLINSLEFAVYFKIICWVIKLFKCSLDGWLSSYKNLQLLQRTQSSSVPTTHTVELTTVYNSSFRRPNTLFGTLRAPALKSGHSHIDTHIGIWVKIKKYLEKRLYVFSLKVYLTLHSAKAGSPFGHDALVGGTALSARPLSLLQEKNIWLPSDDPEYSLPLLSLKV